MFPFDAAEPRQCGKQAEQDTVLEGHTQDEVCVFPDESKKHIELPPTSAAQ